VGRPAYSCAIPDGCAWVRSTRAPPSWVMSVSVEAPASSLMSACQRARDRSRGEGAAAVGSAEGADAVAPSPDGSVGLAGSLGLSGPVGVTESVDATPSVGCAGDGGDSGEDGVPARASTGRRSAAAGVSGEDVGGTALRRRGKCRGGAILTR